MNEIILSKEGNCYIGALAQRFATGLSRLPALFRLDDAQWHVFELAAGGEVIHRASQSRRNLAEKYMTENRVLVYRQGGAPETPEQEAYQRQMEDGGPI